MDETFVNLRSSVIDPEVRTIDYVTSLLDQQEERVRARNVAYLVDRYIPEVSPSVVRGG